MPFLIKAPGIKPGSICNDIISNVDFAPTWLEFAGLRAPSYMQGDSFLSSCKGTAVAQSEDAVAYHRYWMHGELIHNAYVRFHPHVSSSILIISSCFEQAHYGIRNSRYKLIFWYNEGYGLPGTREGGEEQEWELFDCEKDPMELFNAWSEVSCAAVREKMVRLLEAKMADIGDEPAHPVGLPAEKLAEMYKPGANIAAKAEQHNM